MSDSDVYSRQILTYKDGPRTERVNVIMAVVTALITPLTHPVTHPTMLTAHCDLLTNLCSPLSDPQITGICFLDLCRPIG